MRKGKGVRSLGLLVALAGCGLVMRAAGTRAAGEEDRHVVTVFVAPAGTGLPLRLRGRLATDSREVTILEGDRIDPKAVVAEVTAENSAHVRIWIDLNKRGEARLIFSHPARERFAIRRVDVPPERSEVTLESIGIVVQSAIDTLVRGATFELTRPEAERVLVVAAAPAPPLARATPPPALLTKELAKAQVRPAVPADGPVLSAAVIYGANVLAPRELPVVHGPGGLLALAWPRLEAVVFGQYLLAGTVDGGAIDAKLGMVSVRAGLLWRWLCGRGGCVKLGGSIGPDLSWIAPFADPDSPSRVQPAPARWVTSPMLRAAAEWEATRAGLRWAVNFFVDVDALGARLLVQSPAGEERALGPWRVRPGLLIAIGF